MTDSLVSDIVDNPQHRGSQSTLSRKENRLADHSAKRFRSTIVSAKLPFTGGIALTSWPAQLAQPHQIQADCPTKTAIVNVYAKENTSYFALFRSPSRNMLHRFETLALSAILNYFRKGAVLSSSPLYRVSWLAIARLFP